MYFCGDPLKKPITKNNSIFGGTQTIEEIDPKVRRRPFIDIKEGENFARLI